MAFGQQPGPPASPRQVKELLELLEAAGHRDFRDARGPMGFTQRQAAGKFTRDELKAFVDRLRDGDGGDGDDGGDGGDGGDGADGDGVAGGETRAPAPEHSLRWVAAERLAGELRRRGWTVTGPRAPS